jgi:O-antigen biosynthesis protein WbqP
MKRPFDFTMAFGALVLLSVPMLIISVFVKVTSKGQVFYWSDRVGRDNEIFKMPKFRTMRVNTPAVATHLMRNPAIYLTPIGSFLRKFSLDELPQLYSILKGDMSFVGPRPALYNQDDLIDFRTGKGIHKLIPGITGWAQVNGRDELPIPVKVEFDEYYLKNRSFIFDLKILWMTFVKVVRREGVTH